MSDPSPFIGVPIDVQRAVVSANLNSTFLFILGMGIYTTVYIGTAYLYMTRKATQHRGIVTTITLLYLIVVGQTCIQWLSVKQNFIDNGDTRLSIFTSDLLNSPAERMGILVLQYMGYIIADGLLIWRCFNMYGSSFQRIALLIILYFLEILLAVASMGYQGWLSFDDAFATLEDGIRSEIIGQIIDGTFSIVVALTSISATFLICMRILSATQEESRSRARYQHVVYMLIQSSMLHTLSVIVYAIAAFTTLLPGARNLVISTELDDYASSLSLIITGLAPTLMVAGVSLSSGNVITEDSSAHISGLQFDHQSTRDQLSQEKDLNDVRSSKDSSNMKTSTKEDV